MPTHPEEHVIIYTDGGCDPNPGVGGWGVVMMYKGRTRELSGGDPDTTNNRMEMTAAISALEALKRPCSVVISTDSEYLQKGVTTWMHAWKRSNWKRKTGAVKNVDLWQRLDALIQGHQVRWQWVRGHAGDPINERCDELASEAIARIKRGGK